MKSGEGQGDSGKSVTAALTTQNQNGPTEIDILVAYTPAVFGAFPLIIFQHIDIAVASANLSYQRSGINIKLNLVGTLGVSYVESGKNYSEIVEDFATMEDVYKSRIETGADIVVLIVNNFQACGEALSIPANASNSYAVVSFHCLLAGLSLPHELGHLQGAYHNPESCDRIVNPSEREECRKLQSDPPYAHGYLNGKDGWGTIMAYADDPKNCPDKEVHPRVLLVYPVSTPPM